MDCAIDTSATQEGAICSVNDGIDMEGRDVCNDQLDPATLTASTVTVAGWPIFT